MFVYLYYFLSLFIYFERDRDGMSEEGAEKQEERERENPMQAPWEHGVRHGAQTYETCEIMN